MEPARNTTDPSYEAAKQAAIEEAWDRALQMLPALTLLDATSNFLIGAMAETIDAALASGVIERQQLVEATLTRIPRPPSPGRQKPPGSLHM